MTDLIERVEDTPAADVGLTEGDNFSAPPPELIALMEKYYRHVGRPASPDLGDVVEALREAGEFIAWHGPGGDVEKALVERLDAILAKLEGA